MEITIFILLVIGISLVFYSYKNLKNEIKEKKIKDEAELAKYEEIFNALNITVDEGNKVGEDFNKLATEIFAELDNKHQELMVIYKLIEEKSKGQSNTNILESDKKSNNDDKQYANETRKKDFKINIKNNDENKFDVNSKKDNVLNLKRQGLQIDDIAKKLNLGKREVKLIIDFSEGVNE